ncbi:MAG TPA: DsbA family protein [Trueperaceae bacterium]|nr:DsbA family protein [Trueperaceae bacterium]
MPEKVTVFFDYTCPFSWRAAELVEWVAGPLELDFEWRHFSLYQFNHGAAASWQLWNEKIDPEDDMGSKGLLPFLASQAARRQGRDAYRAFRLGLLRARHQYHRAMTRTTIDEVASCQGLHMPTFSDDLANPECRTVLAQEHHSAALRNVFGTPTFAFPAGDVAYLRLRELPRDADEAVRLFAEYRHLLETYPYLETVRRPRPKGN